MKATGVVRRIDDLGRVVIPKEIRRNLKIHEGDPLEIYVDKEDIVLKRFDTMRTLENEAKVVCEIVANNTELSVCISDLKQIVAVSNTQRLEYDFKYISEELIQVINKREVFSTKKNSSIKVIDEDKKEEYISQYIIPIIVDTYILGALIIFSTIQGRIINDIDIKLANMAVKFMEKTIE